MEQVKNAAKFKFLSDLYVEDISDGVLLAEYPSSNSDQTRFQNRDRFVIHDPFPPPRFELLKYLGPHHLMCGWGDQLEVASEFAPPRELIDHWARMLGQGSVPRWTSAEDVHERKCITLFPHQSLPASSQVVDPAVNYWLHSKEVLAEIDCPQADVLSKIQYPCIIKLSHGYAGLGNFLIENSGDQKRMESQLQSQWPNAKVVINSVIKNVVGDFGVQFYLHRDGTAVWLGVTEQHFNDDKKWCGGSYSRATQEKLIEPMQPFINSIGSYLADRGYFGVVGFDVLQDMGGDYFLVDLNPRLTGITPFLMAARSFDEAEDVPAGVYQASCRFSGTLKQLLAAAESHVGEKILVLSAFEDRDAGGTSTLCHLSASGADVQACQDALSRLLS